MITVVLPTASRAEMLRTALRSIERQTARSEIAQVIVSENGVNRHSETVCKEFSSLPITYIFRSPSLSALEHGSALYLQARNLPHQYVAVLHDDDWWGINHISNGLRELRAQPEAMAYWSTSYFVHAESSWFIQAWNMSCWMATGFGSLTEVAKFDQRRAALACVGSAPAAYSSLIAQKGALEESYRNATKTGYSFDSDRLLFLELSKRGPLLVNLVPEVFVRRHPTQLQETLSAVESGKQMAASTCAVLAFCEEHGIDLSREWQKLYDECPIPAYRPYFTDMIDPRVMEELKRQNALPFQDALQQRRKSRWYVRQVCPPLLWKAGKRMKAKILSEKRERVPRRAWWSSAGEED